MDFRCARRQNAPSPSCSYFVEVPSNPEDSAAKSFSRTFSPNRCFHREVVPHNPSVASRQLPLHKGAFGCTASARIPFNESARFQFIGLLGYADSHDIRIIFSPAGSFMGCPFSIISLRNSTSSGFGTILPHFRRKTDCFLPVFMVIWEQNSNIFFRKE